jgi:hypothetical protein
LDQQVAAVVEDQQRKRPVQHAAALMAQRLAHMAEAPIGFVHQNQGVWICHNGAAVKSARGPVFVHIANLSVSSFSPTFSGE